MAPAPPPVQPLSTAPAAPTHYEVLALDRGASDEEIRRMTATNPAALFGLG
jgi:hypothetical protein